ncbi:MAG: hypothetical protein RJB62_802 [Pseudomonadota bacterium]|jgi:hypothetical protein
MCPMRCRCIPASSSNSIRVKRRGRPVRKRPRRNPRPFSLRENIPTGRYVFGGAATDIHTGGARVKPHQALRLKAFLEERPCLSLRPSPGGGKPTVRYVLICAGALSGNFRRYRRKAQAFEKGKAPPSALRARSGRRKVRRTFRYSPSDPSRGEGRKTECYAAHRKMVSLFS